jgi:hypothetical protein
MRERKRGDKPRRSSSDHGDVMQFAGRGDILFLRVPDLAT